MKRLEKAAEWVLAQGLEVQSREALLLITQVKQAPLAQIFKKVAEKARLEAFLLELPDSHAKRPLLSHSSRSMIAASAKAIVFSPIFDAASLSWLRRQNQIKVVFWSHLDEESIQRYLRTDWPKLRERCRKLADILTIGRNLKIASENGQVLEMSIHHRKGELEALPVNNERCCASVPAGRAYIAPLVNSVEGEIHLDRLAGQRTASSQPSSIKVVEGRLRLIRGGRAANTLRQLLKSKMITSAKDQSKTARKDGRRIVEIGFGLNENAIFGNGTLEDEKVNGSIHLGFGRGLGTGKGLEVFARGIITKPTVTIDGMEIIGQGKLKFE